MDRRGALVLLLAAALAAGALFAFYLVQSQAGLKSSPRGPDWASHLAMIDLIERGEDVRAHRAQIGTGVVSPLFAHGLAAALSSLTGLSTIRAIAIVASLAVIVSVVVAAARSVWVVLAVAQNRLARLAGWLAAATCLLAFGNIGLGFYGQIDQANYFFSQTVGTAVALLALTAVQAGVAREDRVSLLAISVVPVLAFILAKIHLVPALWFAAAGAICVLSLNRPLRQSLALAALIALLSAALMLAEPASLEMPQLPQVTQAVLNLRLASGLFQLNAHPVLLTGALLALAALIAIVALSESPSRLRFRLLNLHAGAIAVLLLGLLTLLALLARGGTGYYGLAKYGYLFAAETALLAGHIAAMALNRFGQTPAKPAFAVLALLLAIFVQQRAAPPDRRDQSFLIQMQRALAEVARSLPDPAPYPLDERLSLTERLYLFTGPMGQAKDRRAQKLLGRDLENTLGAARESLSASLVRSVVPRWSGERIELNRIPAPSPLIFFGRWGATGEAGRVADPPVAHLAFHIAPESAALALCLLLPGEQAQPPPSFALNGAEISVEAFAGGGTASVIALPLTGIGPRGDAVLSVLVRDAPNEVRRPRLLLKAMWVAPSCT